MPAASAPDPAVDPTSGFMQRGASHGRRRRPGIALLLPLLVLTVALAGCGGSSNKSAAPTTTTTDQTVSNGVDTTLQLAADPTGKLEFDKMSLEAPAGNVTIVLTNDAPVAHDVAIEGNGVDVKSDIVDNGGIARVSAKLEPGTYTFYCTVPGHEDAGMKGTLTVK